MRRLKASDAEHLGIFFERNDRFEVTGFFKAFQLNMETAKKLLNPARKDQFFVMEGPDKFLAFSMLRGWDEGYDTPSFGIFVDWEYHGCGYGKRLCEWTFRWADQTGVPKVRLSVYEKNTHAINIYKKLGFIENARQYDKDKNASIIMHRTRQNIKTKVFTSTQALIAYESLIDRLSYWYDAGIFCIEMSNYKVDNADEFLKTALLFPGALLIHHFFPAERHNLVLNLASPSPSVRQETLLFFKRSIDWSEKIGSPFFSFHAGYISDPVDRNKYGFVFNTSAQKEAEAALNRFTSALKELAKYAAEHNIFLLVENNIVTKENRDKLLLSKPDEFMNLFERLQETKNVGILLDWGHWLVTSNTYRLNLDSFKSLCERINGIHLHTNNGLADEHLPYSENDPCMNMIKKYNPKFISLEGKYPTIAVLQNSILKMEKTLQ